MARCHSSRCRVHQRQEFPRQAKWLAVRTRVRFATLRNNKSSRRWSRRDGIVARLQRCWASRRQLSIVDCVITIWKDGFDRGTFRMKRVDTPFSLNPEPGEDVYLLEEFRGSHGHVFAMAVSNQALYVSAQKLAIKNSGWYLRRV